MDEVRTGFYSKHAEFVFNSILIALSDNSLHNSFNVRYLFSNTTKRTFDSMAILRADDGEIIFKNKRNTWRSNFFNHYSNAQDFIARMAYVLKFLANKGAKATSSWYRSNEENVWFDDADGEEHASYRDIYFIYDTFLGRASARKSYGQDYATSMIGSPDNPFLVELRKNKAAEIAKLNEEYSKKCNEFYKEREAKVSAAYKEEQEKRAGADIEKIKAIEELNAKFAELENQCSMMAS